MAELDVKKSVKAQNDEIAEKNREIFRKSGALVVNLMGSPGAGKTTLLEHVLPRLAKKLNVAVIEGDVATDNDAKRIAKTGVTALQIETGGACHLDATMIGKRLGEVNVEKLDLLLIENVGNLVCPAGFDLGEDLRIVVLSLPEGDDKPEKYPAAFLRADWVALTKTDLAPYVGADIGRMKESLARINPMAKAFCCAFQKGEYEDGGLSDGLIRLAEAKRK